MPIPVNVNQRSGTADKLRNFRFRVSFGSKNNVVMGFRRVSGIKQDIEVIEYREGGQDAIPRKLPGNLRMDPLTLETGAAATRELWEWFEQVFNIADGKGQEEFRSLAYIGIYQPHSYVNDESAIRTFEVIESWPSSISLADLDAGANDVLIESIVLQHEGCFDISTTPAIQSESK